MQWAMQSLSNETLTLSPAQYLPYCNGTLPCTFFIAVTGFLAQASYTLLVTTPNDTTTLVNGIPQVCVCARARELATMCFILPVSLFLHVSTDWSGVPKHVLILRVQRAEPKLPSH